MRATANPGRKIVFERREDDLCTRPCVRKVAKYMHGGLRVCPREVCGGQVVPSRSAEYIKNIGPSGLFPQIFERTLTCCRIQSEPPSDDALLSVNGMMAMRAVKRPVTVPQVTAMTREPQATSPHKLLMLAMNGGIHRCHHTTMSTMQIQFLIPCISRITRQSATHKFCF